MTKESPNDAKRRVRIVVNRLRKAYPGASTALHHRSALELLVATILSAQCTDERVNKVTPDLFARYPTAGDYARADRSELEAMIRSSGFYRNKAKSIQAACGRIATAFGGEVPQAMEELLTLSGVARKTANVVLGNFYGKAEGVVVDTHVFRLAHRLGLSSSKTAELVERDLMGLVPKRDWIDIGNLLILHGRAVCAARGPRCDACPLESHCPKIGVPPPKKNKEASKPKRPLRERIRAAKKRR